jgi:transposase
MEVEMARFDLKDFEWSAIQPLLPNKPRGVARVDDSHELRRSLDERGAWANIKSLPNRKNVPAFSSYLYRYRNLVPRDTTKRPKTSSPE